MSFLRKVEQTLDKRLRGIFGGSNQGPGSREAIELYRDALDQIGARATAGKRGDRVFPFDVVRVELRALDAERKSLLEALFEPGQMVEDIRAALAGERVTAPANLAVSIHYPPDAAVEMRVICEKTAPVEAPPVEAAAPAPQFPLIPVLVRTLAGVSSAPEYVADRLRVNIGREQDVVDAMGRAVRRNDLYFPEGGDEANATVSRSHAHLRFDGTSGEWRIYDDGSTLGTSIFRDGKRIEVPGHGPRGVMLLPGDEIYLGQARVRLEIYKG
jgi:hypothetical protein